MDRMDTFNIGWFCGSLMVFIFSVILGSYSRNNIVIRATVAPSLTEIYNEHDNCKKDLSNIESCNEAFQANIDLHKYVNEKKNKEN